MSLGSRIYQARLEAGLSQRQLCGETITRNMLSQIEHDAVQPSLHTLRFLADRLGKPVSFFLDEQVVISPNTAAMTAARQHFETGDYSGALDALDSFQSPDEVFEQERWLLTAKCCLALAQQAADENRLPYALELLRRAEAAGKNTLLYGPELERQRKLLLAEVSAETQLDFPEEDRALLIRAKLAFARENPNLCARLLDAVETRTAQWHLLRGEVWLLEQDYAQAAWCFQQAEEVFPRETAGKLERCFRELEDYKMAYFYACKAREVK